MDEWNYFGIFFICIHTEDLDLRGVFFAIFNHSMRAHIKQMAQNQ